MTPRTALDLTFEEYGRSVLGAPLLWIPPREELRLLLIAGIHGEEPDTTVILSRSLRSIPQDAIAGEIGIILAANPDGLALGTRGNAHRVDLNRNFPSGNWQFDPVPCRWHADEELEIPILTGEKPASEPESSALIDLIEKYAPQQVLTIHGPLACVDDPEDTPLGRWLAERCDLPLVTEIGYPTPGSMGTWAANRKQLPWITWEFPPEPIESLSKKYVPILCEILRGNPALES